MQLPVQISSRNLNLSPAAEQNIRDKAAKLEQFYDRIMGCRIMVEAPHRHHNKGVQYRVRIDLTVPEEELVARAEDEDLYVAIRDAFDAMRKQLTAFVERRRGEVKRHEASERGRIVRIFPDRGFGFLETPDGREIYFHKNSVVQASFGRLQVGDEVRFHEEMGIKGPQASSVIPVPQ